MYKGIGLNKKIWSEKKAEGGGGVRRVGLKISGLCVIVPEHAWKSDAKTYHCSLHGISFFKINQTQGMQLKKSSALEMTIKISSGSL